MIRPFQRSDREQLTALVNAHIAAVVPGASVSVNALMTQLEREPDEAIVDPWVAERRTLVAIQRDMVAGGVHLLRYAGDERVSESYRAGAEIRWIVHGHADRAVGDALVAEACAVMDAWGATRQWADGSLPGPFVYGIPDAWPHVRATLERAGFTQEGNVELVLVARVDDLQSAPELDVELRRTLGSWTRLSAIRGGNEVGYIELDTDLTARGTLARYAGWADIGNLEYGGDRELGRWLLAHAGDWLRLGRVERVVGYALPSQTDELELLLASGFQQLVRTERGWVRRR